MHEMCANSTKVLQSDVNSPEIQTADSNNLMAQSVCFVIIKCQEVWRVTVKLILAKVKNPFSPQWLLARHEVDVL
jgi:hypothetical protein